MKNSKYDKLLNEKATRYPNISVRQFLLNKKRMTESQYKKALGVLPLAVWENKQIEVQAQINNRTVEKNIESCIQLNSLNLNAAQFLTKLGFAMASRYYKNDKKLLNAVNIIQKSQEIFHKAVGFSEKLEADKLKAEKESAQKLATEKKSEFQRKMEEMDYEDVVELIEIRREMKAKNKANAEIEVEKHKSDVDLCF